VQTTTIYTVGQKSDTVLVFEFFLLSCYLQFLFTHVSFSLNGVVLVRLPMQASSVFMRIQILCNFVTMVELSNDERCLIHNLRAKKHRKTGAPKEL